MLISKLYAHWYTVAMLDHHLQRSIVYKLAFTPSARFTELKPDTVDNKLFTYHLKKVVQEGLVIKSEDGVYTLTSEGRRVSTGALDREQSLITERPLSALFLIIRRKADNAWLFYRRGTHPLIGQVGFMHCLPSFMSTANEAASEQCEAKTGLIGEFTPLGGGFVHFFKNNELESYTHFTLLYCDDIKGELLIRDQKAEYFWETDPDFSTEGMIPTTVFLKELYTAKQPFFIEKTFHI